MIADPRLDRPTPQPTVRYYEGRVEQLERQLLDAEHLAASRLDRILDLVEELARRDWADNRGGQERTVGEIADELGVPPRCTCGRFRGEGLTPDPASHATACPVRLIADHMTADRIVRDEPPPDQAATEATEAVEVVAPVAEEPTAYAVGFPRPSDGLPCITHTAADRARAELVLASARLGEPRYTLYTVHGPLADRPADA